MAVHNESNAALVTQILGLGFDVLEELRSQLTDPNSI